MTLSRLYAPLLSPSPSGILPSPHMWGPRLSGRTSDKSGWTALTQDLPGVSDTAASGRAQLGFCVTVSRTLPDTSPPKAMPPYHPGGEVLGGARVTEKDSEVRPPQGCPRPTRTSSQGPRARSGLRAQAMLPEQRRGGRRSQAPLARSFSPASLAAVTVQGSESQAASTVSGCSKAEGDLSKGYWAAHRRDRGGHSPRAPGPEFPDGGLLSKSD